MNYYPQENSPRTGINVSNKGRVLCNDTLILTIIC